LTDKPYVPALPLAELAPGAMRCVMLGDEPVLVRQGRGDPARLGL